MCIYPKSSKTYVSNSTPEVIPNAKPADASVQKASQENRIGNSGFVSENIKTSNKGIEDEVISSKKKLLGE